MVVGRRGEVDTRVPVSSRLDRPSSSRLEQPRSSRLDQPSSSRLDGPSSSRQAGRDPVVDCWLRLPTKRQKIQICPSCELDYSAATICTRPGICAGCDSIQLRPQLYVRFCVQTAWSILNWLQLTRILEVHISVVAMLIRIRACSSCLAFSFCHHFCPRPYRPKYGPYTGIWPKTLVYGSYYMHIKANIWAITCPTNGKH